MLWRLILAFTSVIAWTAAASGADIYHGPNAYGPGPGFAVVNWSGLYVGANAGYGWSENTDNLDPTGGFGGGQIGYNFQSGNIVYGLEADFQGSGISDSVPGDKSSLDWFGSVRGRLGYAFNRALIYSTAGFGYGQVHNNGWGIGSETQTGWVVGGGVEYKLAPNWSVKGEYQYFDLEAPWSSWVGPLGDGWGDRTQFSTIRVGVNYFVGQGYEPLK